VLRDHGQSPGDTTFINDQIGSNAGCERCKRPLGSLSSNVLALRRDCYGDVIRAVLIKDIEIE
jgi:hypothetical protein